MSGQDAKGKPIATFQTDQAVRKRILDIIKKKPTKQIEGSNELLVKRDQDTDDDETEDDLVVKKPKRVKTYGRNGSASAVESSSEDSNVNIHLPVQCSICGQMYNSAPLLNKHVKRVHLKEKNHLCQFCKFRGYTKREVLIHEQRAHIKAKPLKCPFCDYVTTDNQSLYSHLSTHSSNKAFKCESCPYMCGWKKQLTRHAEAHASPEHVKCSVCGIVSKDKKQDLVHFSVEHSVKLTTNAGKFQLGRRNGKAAHKREPYGLVGWNSVHCDSGASDSNQIRISVSLNSVNSLLSDNNELSGGCQSGCKNTDPHLIISKDKVANHFQVLNVSDLVRKQNYKDINSSFTPETVQLRKPQPSRDRSSAHVNNSPASLPQKKVSILKSVLRSDIKEKLLAASQRANISSVQQGRSTNLSYDVNTEFNQNGDAVYQRSTSSDSFDMEPINANNEVFNTGVKMESELTESDIDVIGSDLEDEFISGNDSLLKSNMDRTKIGAGAYEDMSNLDFIEQELQSFIEKYEKQNASAEENKNVIYINSGDIQEIITVIENKMNSDNLPSMATEEQQFETVTEPSDKISEQTQVQLVLQVPDDANSSTECQDNETPSCSRAVGSVELSVLDQILKNLLQSKTESAGKITVLNSDSDKVYEINLPS